jgi:serine/threonine-protein kinase
MGSVWVAEHLGLGTQVAVKFVSEELAAAQPQFRARFALEAAVSAKLASPHVVRTLDFGAMDDGTQFLVMELLQGETLEERMARAGPLSPDEAITVTRQVANALDEAHGLGTVHRDIKPANVFLSRAGRDLFAKVLDFGIAKVMDPGGAAGITQTGAMLGTPAYMCPEILMSARRATAQADLWALAVTAYEMLTGVQPFRGATVPSVVVAIHDGKFAPPSSVRPDVIGAPVDAFFARAFAREASARFPSALALADAFEEACRSARLPASRPGPTATAPGLAAREGGGVAPTRIDPDTEGPRLRRLAMGLTGIVVVLTLAGVAVHRLVGRGYAEHFAAHARASGSPSVFTTSAVSPGPGSTAGVTPASAHPEVSVPRGASRAAGAWLGAFTLRSDGRTAASLLDAHNVCRASQRLVCSEAQWQAACERDPSVGQRATWTAAAQAGLAVSRGGSGCDDRRTARPGEALSVTCCDAGVATVGTSEPFLHATNDKLAAYQQAINAADAARAASLVDDTVFYGGKPLTRAGYQSASASYFRQHPQTLMYDRCQVEVRKTEDGWRAVCALVMAKDGKLLSLQQTLSFGGPTGKLRRIEDDQVRQVE